mgnify:CR=1 FL=1
MTEKEFMRLKTRKKLGVILLLIFACAFVNLLLIGSLVVFFEKGVGVKIQSLGWFILGYFMFRFSRMFAAKILELFK